jgi:hypothetical protein
LAHLVREVCDERGVLLRENATLRSAVRSHYRFVRQMGIKPV